MMDPARSVLLTDLYQLTMLQGYFEQRMDERAAFEFFVRNLPAGRNFLMAAGLAQALDYLEHLRFMPEELDWLNRSGRFTPAFIDYLAEFRFRGDVFAMPEGTLFFTDEPILRVVAPLPQAQLVESRLINLLHFQTVIASKAARCVLAAPNKLLVDFGFRRAHGAEAGLLAARATYLAGFGGSSTVLAGPMYDVPVFGTMAHSFVQAHEDELTAFDHFASAQPDNVVLLIDTYDTEAAAAKVVELAPRLRERGIAIKAVRLDSGDLVDHAKRVRAILDRGGLTETGIFSSGSLDEYELQRLLNAGAPIDGFGVGTRLDTSADAPYLDCAYKMVEYGGEPRMKLSEGKITWPGRKQVYRRYDDAGEMVGDTLALETDDCAGEPLLSQVMRNGRIVRPIASLAKARVHARNQLNALPSLLRGPTREDAYVVEVAPALRVLRETMSKRLANR
ncbi:MAG: nicotinate phosphoribosyltransferase [Gammaproteobacteria bacterium SG8_47]|nr:MAG: nicotinate phosphoribosyltransferase [Gammaproteobacteria bacterium SG8_47]